MRRPTLLAALLLMQLACASAQKVTIRTQPDGAQVLVDGQDKGPSPATFDDEPSDGHYYKIRLVRPGFRPKEVVLKQVDDPGAVACTGLAYGCCPPLGFLLLKSRRLPKTEYVIDLEPEGYVAPPPGPYAPPPVQPQPGSYPPPSAPPPPYPPPPAATP